MIFGYVRYRYTKSEKKDVLVVVVEMAVVVGVVAETGEIS